MTNRFRSNSVKLVGKRPSRAGAAAVAAEATKRRKYAELGSEYMFAPFGVETLGPWGPDAKRLFKEISSRLVDVSGDLGLGHTSDNALVWQSKEGMPPAFWGLCHMTPAIWQTFFTYSFYLLHAEYHEDDIYLAHRVLQAYSTAEFVKLTTSPADISILAGDLNTAPGDLEFRLISELAGLVDPFDLNCENTDASVRKPSGTSDNANNSYSNIKLAAKCPDGKRIDHILFHANPTFEVHVENFGNPLEDKVPGQPFSYSDHNAVSLQLKLQPSQGKRLSKTNSMKVCSPEQAVAEAIKVCEEAKVTICSSKKVYLTSGGLLFMLLIGTVGFWPNYLIYDIIKLVMTGFCFYSLVMGLIWNQIELNSLKAGLSGLENFRTSRDEKHLHTA